MSRERPDCAEVDAKYEQLRVEYAEHATRQDALLAEQARLRAEEVELTRSLAKIRTRLSELGGNRGVIDSVARAMDRLDASIKLLAPQRTRVRVRSTYADPSRLPQQPWLLAVVDSNGPKQARVVVISGESRERLTFPPKYGHTEIHPDDRHLLLCLRAQ